MPNLREYFYPYIDDPGCAITYEYKLASNDANYRKSRVYPGIAIPDYPTIAGATYFTRYDVFWDGSGWNDSKSLWYMRQRDNGIIEEIADEGLECDQWAAWGPIYYLYNNITHAHGDGSEEFVSDPICAKTRSGPGTYTEYCTNRWYSVCKYISYHASWGGYSDVVKMTFQHGGIGRDSAPDPICSSPHSPPSGYVDRPPCTTGYWEEKWFAKGHGLVYNKIMWYGQPHCDGSYYSGTAWEHYLNTYYGDS